jgi:hypothetical protein
VVYRFGKTSPTKRTGRFGAGNTASTLTTQPVEEVKMADISPITIARFWSKVSVTPSTKSCWEWQGCTDSSGYGNFRVPQFGRVNIGAHRVSYMLYNGDFPPDGMLVRHTCDNPRCVNPLHLEYGTKKDNAQDMVDRGRVAVRDRRGESNGAAKLDDSKVRDIRSLLAAGRNTVDLARQYGVSHDTISLIASGKTWKHVA